MAVRTFEVFHGMVLTKLLRSERPITLRMIETNTAENWSSYVLNDAIRLFISYSTSPRAVSRPSPSRNWQFTFSPNQLRQLKAKEGDKPVYAALVCGSKSYSGEDMEVCLLDQEQLRSVLDFSESSESLLIRCPAGKGQLRVIKDRTERFLVPRNRIDKWEIPGG